MEIPRLSAKESLILRLLVGSQELYGLQMVKQSNGELKRGTVYVTLSRMEEKGYVESRKESRPPGSGPSRRLYQATGYGAQVLQAWESANATFVEAFA